MRWLSNLHSHTSIFTKVWVANGAIVAIGSVLAVLIAAHDSRGEASGTLTVTLLIAAGLLLSLGVNYLILRVAFRPLTTLQAILDRVRRGDFSARVPDVTGDSDMARIAETANLMLDRLTEHRQAVAAQILRAQEAERKRIARELHDETSQSLTSILVNLEVVEQGLADQTSELAGRVRMAKETARRTLDETRRLMFDLRPSVLDDLGLVPALRWFISQRVQPMGLNAAFQATGFEARLPEDLETALFRIVQEAMTNAVKHARARHLDVALTRSGGKIHGVVRDDGVGFHPVHVVSREDKDRGLGLFGMQERAALVGGAVHVTSAPGRGTSVVVSVPDRF